MTDAAGLEAVTGADQSKPLLGLFTDGNFPTRYNPTTATIGGAATPTTCSEHAGRLPSELSLTSLTQKAIDLLNTGKGGKGFFLQVEGASIDKRDHAADACGQIGETIDFDEAVQAALAFAQADGHTLVIVTADHAHSSQIVGENVDTPGFYAAVATADGAPLRVSHATGKTPPGQQHTGAHVPVAAIGPQASNVMGVRDQTDLFFTLIGRDRGWHHWDD